MRGVDGGQLAAQGGGGGGVGDIAGGLARLEVLERQGGGGAVAARDLVHDAHGLVVAALAHEVLGRLVDGEEHEADEEHQHCDAPHGDHKVAPPEVGGPRAHRALLARVVAQQRPGDQRGHHLRQRPVD